MPKNRNGFHGCVCVYERSNVSEYVHYIARTSRPTAQTNMSIINFIYTNMFGPIYRLFFLTVFAPFKELFVSEYVCVFAVRNQTEYIVRLDFYTLTLMLRVELTVFYLLLCFDMLFRSKLLKIPKNWQNQAEAAEAEGDDEKTRLKHTHGSHKKQHTHTHSLTHAIILISTNWLNASNFLGDLFLFTTENNNNHNNNHNSNHRKKNHRPFGFNEVNHNRQVFVALCDHFLIECYKHRVHLRALVHLCMGMIILEYGCASGLIRSGIRRQSERARE